MGQLRNVPEDAHSISSNQITCLFLDDSDHLWAGHPRMGDPADLHLPCFDIPWEYHGKRESSSSSYPSRL